MRIVLTGGGTGGHVAPNMAVIGELKALKTGLPELLYIGSKSGMEKAAAENAGVRYKAVATGKLRRYFSWKNFVDALRVPVGFFQARKVLREFGPDVVFSKGGYVSVPVMMAAKLLKIRTILHESDMSIGLANKICCKFADTICLSFADSIKRLPTKLQSRAVVTGNIVRKEIMSGDKKAGLKFLGLDEHRPILLVMGGSLGAMQINELVRAGLNELLKRFQIVHISGRGNLDISLKHRGYRQFEFLNEQLKDVYAAADMVVTRGGANSLSELAVLKKKVIIIPLVGKASRGEQIDNARYFSRVFGWSLLSGDITREDFVNAIELLNKQEVLKVEDFKNGLTEVVKIITKSKI